MLLGFGLFSRILVKIGLEGDNEDRGDGYTDVRRIDFPCVLQDFVPFGATA